MVLWSCSVFPPQFTKILLAQRLWTATAQSEKETLPLEDRGLYFLNVVTDSRQYKN